MSDEAKATPSPVVSWVTQNRENVSYGLIFFGLVAVVFGVIWGAHFDSMRAAAASTENQPKSEGKSPEEELSAKLKEGDKDKAKTNRLYNGDHLPAAVWAFFVAVLLFGAAGWQLSRDPAPDQEMHFTRLWILVVGGGVGLTTAILGVSMLYRWQESLVKWLGDKETREARWILLGLVTLFGGLLVMFVSALPARAEERNNASLRRVVYGYNSVQTGMLLVVILVVVNIISYLVLPNKLDTTAAGFYTLKDPSKQLLASLKQPVKVYTIIPEDFELRDNRSGLVYSGLYTDTTTLLKNCEEASPLFRAINLSTSLNGKEIFEVWRKTGLSESVGPEPKLGLVVTVGDDDKNSSFIRYDDLFEGGDPRGKPQIVYQGEAKLMTEITFLGEGRQSPVIYFTQGNGELSIMDGGEAEPDRSALELKKYLNARKFDVRPLTFGLGETPSLENASMVAVVGLAGPVSEKGQAILREYLFPRDAGKKPGKLLAFIPPFPDVKNNVASTGLESILAEMSIQLENSRLFVAQDAPGPANFVYFPEISRDVPPGNPLRPIYSRLKIALQDVRPVRAMSGSQGAIHSMTLLTTNARLTQWQESTYENFEPSARWRDIQKDSTLALSKKVGTERIPLAAIAFEGANDAEKPRALVMGTSSFLSDAPDPRNSPQIAHSMFGGAVEWLREKPKNIGIEPRAVREFTLDHKPDFTRIFGVPVLLVLLSISGLGFGVWLSRKK